MGAGKIEVVLIPQQVAWVERFCETRGLLVTDAANAGFALAQPRLLLKCHWGMLPFIEI